MKQLINKIIILFVIFVFGIQISLSQSKIGNNENGNTRESKIEKIDFDVLMNEKWVTSTLHSLTLEEKVGQLVIPFALTYYRSDDDPYYLEMVRNVKENKVGGYIFSLGDVYEMAMLSNRLQALSKIPLLFTADFEKGVAMRIERSTLFPNNMAIGATGDKNLSYQMGKVIAKEGRALGVHQNYAPVVDLNNNPKNPIINVRSFGENVEDVSNLAIAFIRGTHEGGMVSTIKHFPGHGDTETDSHRDLPVLNFGRDRLYNMEIVPFKRAIDAGVMSVMVAHLSIPAFDTTTNLPTTLSKKVVTDLLHNELNFKGLTVTDAMDMRGVSNHYTTGESSVMAIEAGQDLVLMPSNVDVATAAISKAVKDGRLTIERIEKSVRKILAVKYWLGLHKNKFIDINKVAGLVGTEENLFLSKIIAERSITLLKNDGALLPISYNGEKKIVCISILDNIETGFGNYFESSFMTRYKNISFQRIDPRTTSFEFDKIFDAAKKGDIILIPAYMKVRSFSGSVSFNKDQKRFLDSLYSLSKPTILLSFGNPYIIMEYPNSTVYINAFSDANVSIEATLQTLFGEIKTSGKMPVNIPGLYKIGSGITTEKTSIKSGSPLDAGLNLTAFEKVDKLINKAIIDSAFPGSSLIICKDGITLHKKAYGRMDYSVYSKPMTTKTMFDLASLTKVISTTNATMKLIDEGKIQIDKPVIDYIPEFGQNGKSKITIKNLLLHNSGLPAFKTFYKFCKSDQEVIDSIYACKIEYKTGEKTIYSDLGMITLGKIIEKVSNSTLDNYVKKEFYFPLGMTRTMYNPPIFLQKECAPTEIDNYWRMKTIQGTVHDENSAMLNGVAGHAGLFSTVEDLSLLMQMLLNGGVYGNKKYLNSETIKLFTNRQSESSTRAFGWDTKNKSGYSSCGKLFSDKSFGHTGFTGTSIWADPSRNLFVIFLTNRVFPSRENRKISKVREDLHNAIIECLDDKENKFKGF